MADEYITREELRVSPYDIPMSKVDNKYLEVLQDLTKDIVDKLCLHDFEKEGTVSSPVEKKVSGTGKDTLFTPERIVTLDKIRVYSSLTTYTDYEASEFNVEPKYISFQAFASTPTPRFSIESFPKGSYNIGIFGIWGYETPPTPIKYLQGKLILKIIEDDSFAEKFKTERIGDYDNTIADSDYPITGDRELDVIIKKYRDWGFYAVI